MKTVLVTGATGGIGFHIAAALAGVGSRVLVTGRDSGRGEQAVVALRARGVASLELLLADHALVRENVRFAEEVTRRVDRLDVLVNNVGGGLSPERRETAEGLEDNLARNFAGPLALTLVLLPLLQRSQPARIVNVRRRASADGAARGPVFLVSALEATFSGRYFDGLREKPLPAGLLEADLQERVLALGQNY